MFKSIALVVALAGINTYAYGYDVVEGKVEWTATGTPGFLKINGTGGRLTGHAEAGADGKVSGKFQVALVDYTTGLSLRDKHMKEKYLEVAKYPKAELVLDAWTPTPAESDFAGKLTIKGDTKPVHGKASFRDGKLLAEFTVVITDYPSIGVPSFSGVTVAKDVAVSVEATVK